MMRHTQSLFALAAFAVAAILCYLGAVWAVGVVEAHSTELVHEQLSQAGLDWAKVRADGLQVHITGTAPTEALRFRTVSIASLQVDPGRIRDEMDVTPTKDIPPPRFSLEVLRNEEGISLIGLVPAATGHDPILARVRPLAGSGHVTDMLETSDDPKPAHWDAALGFGLDALQLLPRSKISISAGRVSVRAISSAPEQKRTWEAQLSRIAPPGVKVTLNISAPRPVITPFTLRFLTDAQGARFDACSADTGAVRDRILAAAKQAGATGALNCTIGLGVPSPKWVNAAVEGIQAVKQLGHASITFSDADVTLLAASDVPQTTFTRVVGDLRATLPGVFSLKATLTPKASKDKGPAEFTATLSPQGQVQLRGRLSSEETRAAVTSFAKAAFGAGVVYSAALVDGDLPDGWPVRVLAGLQALAQLHQGALVVRSDMVSVTGISGQKDASDAIARILSDKLGQGQDFSISVKYDKKFDPLAALPKPQECVDTVNAILARHQVTFAPGSDRPDAASQDTLNALAVALRPCERVKMEVAGYTDNQGRSEMNLTLSQARAQAVLNALLDRRVTVFNLVAKGYGEADPIADNSTNATREANRRIEFSLITSDGAAGDAASDETTSNVPADGTAAQPADGGGDQGTADGAQAGADRSGDAKADSAGAVDTGGPGADVTGTGKADTRAAGTMPDDAAYASTAPTDKTIAPRLRPGE